MKFDKKFADARYLFQEGNIRKGEKAAPCYICAELTVWLLFMPRYNFSICSTECEIRLDLKHKRGEL